MYERLKFEGEANVTPKVVARLIWSLDDSQQAEMFNHLYNMADGERLLMMQFLSCRDACERRNDNSLAAFQAMFSSAYKYMW